MNIRLAAAPDLASLHAVVERAYRGDSARLGWTHEADLLEGQRTDLESLAAIIRSPAEKLLIAVSIKNMPLGCVQVSNREGPIAYIGLLCVDPQLQSRGVGRALLGAAETLAAEEFDARVCEMTVIDTRSELIAYYGRRGYVLMNEKRPFPIDLDPPLSMVVLAKPLSLS